MSMQFAYSPIRLSDHGWCKETEINDVDSFWYMAEPIQYCKVKKKDKNKQDPPQKKNKKIK